MRGIFYWVSIAINFTAAGVNCWLIYRNVRLQKRIGQEVVEAASEAVDTTMREVAPAIAFCVMMREAPGVPDSIKRIAANSIPKTVEVFATTMDTPAAPDKIIH